MTVKRFNSLPLGLYRVFWKCGGSSIAAIGNTAEGRRWIAPCNWLSPMMPTEKHYKKYIRGIGAIIPLILK